MKRFGARTFVPMRSRAIAPSFVICSPCLFGQRHRPRQRIINVSRPLTGRLRRLPRHLRRLPLALIASVTETPAHVLVGPLNSKSISASPGCRCVFISGVPRDSPRQSHCLSTYSSLYVAHRLRVSFTEHRDWTKARRPVLLGHIPMEFSSCVYRLK